MKWFTLILLFISCSSIPTKIDPADDLNPIRVFDSISPQIYTISPGEAKYIRIPLHESRLQGEYPLSCNARDVFANIQKNFIEFYLSEDYYSISEYFFCNINIENQIIPVGKFMVVKKDYPRETLSVPLSYIQLSKLAQKRIEKENKLLEDIFSKKSFDLGFPRSFELPINSYETSKFGVQRLFNGQVPDIHFGVDLRAKQGRKIQPSARGRVVWTGNLFVPGNSVIVDHGYGVFTMYSHLSKIDVKVGDLVSKQNTLGEAGATGRVTAPHLHWAASVNGFWVDPWNLVNEHN